MVSPDQSEFVAIFVAAVYFFYYYRNPPMKPVDTMPEELFQRYDFIIVGAGSAGCVVANRLSENPSWKVLLIEAGGDDNYVTDAPILEKLLENTEVSWNYTTVKQKKACGERDGICMYPRGRALGGSSTINAMFYIRGNKADFDEWASMGNPGWSYKEVLPYFIKAENATPKELANSKYHGMDGPLNVQYPIYTSLLRDLYLKAGKEFGLKEVDYNGYEQTGVGKTQYTLNGPLRESTAKAYLDPIINRRNLHICKHSEVTKIKFNHDRAKGVQFTRNEKSYFVEASKEVIISAGPINSPKLLMLSGIGPKDHLESMGICVLADLPVGQNLQDHLLNPLYFSFNRSVTVTYDEYFSNESIIEYAKYQKGPITTFGTEVHLHKNVFSEELPPNIEFELGSLGFLYATVRDDKLVALSSANIHPKSKGTIKLSSKDPKFPPLIDPNYLADKEDLIVARYGLRELIKFMKTPTMKSLGAKISTKYQPKCKSYKNNKKHLIDCTIQNYSKTNYHACGTNKMGPANDSSTVVNHKLLVHGFSNLRVIDASIMPKIIRGNTNAPTIMIGEKGSEFITEKYM